jgi:hypothetical protein
VCSGQPLLNTGHRYFTLYQPRYARILPQMDILRLSDIFSDTYSNLFEQILMKVYRHGIVEN